MNESRNTAYQHPCDTAKAALRGKFTAINACIHQITRKISNKQSNDAHKEKNSIKCLKKSMKEKHKQIKPQIGRRNNKDQNRN